MSVLSPSRTTTAAPRGRALVEERPLRHPDVAAPRVMSRRAWWLVASNFLLPGSAQILAGNRRFGRAGLIATFAMWIVLAAGVLYLGSLLLGTRGGLVRRLFRPRHLEA